MSHATIFVLDQEKAKDVYVNKFGFEVVTDAQMGPDMRWLTVRPPSQPNFEIVLMGTQPSPALDDETSKAIRKMLEGNSMGAGVFDTDDIHETYRDLKAKGIEFLSEPKEEFYGIEAIMRDGCGNWFSLGQPK